jgi:hypothetical protein
MPFSVHSHVIKRLGCTYPLTSSHRRHPVPDSGRDRAQETFASVAGSGANLPTRFRFLFPFFLSRRRCCYFSLPSSRPGATAWRRPDSIEAPRCYSPNPPIQARRLGTPPTQRCDFLSSPFLLESRAPMIGSLLDPT